MDWDDAYAIQDAILQRKLARGARIAGLKCGLTSHAKMKQMGVDTPCFGFLVDSFSVAEGAEVTCSELIHPKVEPEIAFVLKKPLKGPGCHIGAVLAATDFVMPGIEVIDSRYRDFKFDLKSVVADNTSAARFRGGRPRDGRRPARPAHAGRGDGEERPGGIDRRRRGGDGPPGPPRVAMLANHLGKRGQEIPAGTMILSGGVTEAVAVAPGDHVSLRIQHLGSVSLRFV